MPKIKNKSGAKKRFSFTGTGKVKISGLKYPTADGSANTFLLTVYQVCAQRALNNYFEGLGSYFEKFKE